MSKPQRQQHKRIEKLLDAVPTTRKGTINRKIIGKLVDKGRDYLLHATKGYRSTRS
jgi:hypothetical protein